MPPDVVDTLEQIYEAAGYIEADTAGLSFREFEADRRARQLVERNSEITRCAGGCDLDHA